MRPNKFWSSIDIQTSEIDPPPVRDEPKALIVLCQTIMGNQDQLRWTILICSSNSVLFHHSLEDEFHLLDLNPVAAM
jgi:hypothetical protein